jgi:Flp pilus assembly protein TadD
MRIVVLLASTLLAACGSIDFPEIRPHVMPESAAVAPFEKAYEAGKSHLMADRVGLAIFMFEKALVLDPNSVAALNAIGVAYDDLRRPEVAKMYYFKALAIEPNSGDTLNNMAVSATIAGETKTAHELFARAAELDARNSTIRENMRMADASPEGRVAATPPQETDAVAEEEDRATLERTGVAEYTLTIPTALRQRVTAVMNRRDRFNVNG